MLSSPLLASGAGFWLDPAWLVFVPVLSVASGADRREQKEQRVAYTGTNAQTPRPLLAADPRIPPEQTR